jgi:PAS domain S-box-containing protein
MARRYIGQGKSHNVDFIRAIFCDSVCRAAGFMNGDLPALDALLLAKQHAAAADDDIEATFELIADWSLALVPHAKGALIQLLDGDDLVYRAASGAARGFVGQPVARGRTTAGRSMILQGPFLWDDIANHPSPDLQTYRDAGMHALMTVPLVRHGEAIGALEFYARKPFAFGTRDLTVAQLIANLLMSGLAIVNVETAVRARQDSAARFEAITETLPQLIWTMNPAARITYCNRRAMNFLGRKDIKDFADNPLHFVPASHRHGVLQQWMAGSRTTDSFRFECPVQTRQGDQRWMLVHILPVRKADGSVIEWIGAATDIDERKAMELALQDALRTRDLLLHEVNHRVKNSLQIVTGLLALQANRIEHPEARQKLLDARAQVSTIARIHQAIYQSHQHDQVEFIGFLRSLAESLVGKGAARETELVFDAPDILLLPFDRGVPVALVAGEIITNAVKHGSGKDGLRIAVSVRQSGDETIIAIEDNGPGLPADFNPDEIDSLGMEIIFGLAEQAHGRVEYEKGKAGAHFRLILSP